MDAVFLEILNSSISAGWLILAVLLLRLLLKKAPKWSVKLLWAVVGLRLILPFRLESVFSLIPSAQTLPADIGLQQAPAIQSGISYMNSVVNPVLQASMAPVQGDSVNPMQVAIFLAAVVWLLGMVVMGVYALVNTLLLKKRLAESVQLEDVYICDRIPSPFLFGIFRPKIYLPSALEEGDAQFVVAHERAHLRSLDHIWKALGFGILILHWFNPLVWLAYSLFSRDLELACDERVIEHLGSDCKKPYSQALLRCNSPAWLSVLSPLAFGEVGVKARVKNVLHYKKPALWLLIVAVIAVAVTAVCFLTDPVEQKEYSVQEGYSYPVLPGTEEWNALSTLQERIDACYVDPALLRSMTTEALIDTVLNYPLLVNIYAFDTLEMGITSVSNYFAGIGILAQREDAVSCMEACQDKYADSTLSTYHTAILRYLRERKELEEGPVITQLRKKYPEFFDLNTDNGLVVYVWQMAPESYHCILMPVTDYIFSQADIDRNPSANLEEMQRILYSYDISPKKIQVVPIYVGYSSYYYTIDEDYIQDVRQKLLVYYNLDSRWTP